MSFIYSPVQPGVTLSPGIINNVYVVDGVKYTTIQAAVNACSAFGGGMVYLPAGAPSYYTFSTPITIPASVSLVGPGRLALTLNYSGTGAAIVVHPTSAPFYQGAILAGFTLQGPSGGFPDVVGTIGIDMQDTNLYQVYDIEFTRLESGIRPFANTSNYCEANHFHDLYFDTVRYPFNFTSATSANKDFDHNIFEDMWVNLIGSAGSAGCFFLFSSNLVCTAQNLIVRNIVLFPTDTTQVFLRLANAAHTVDKAIFEVKRAVAAGYTTYRPFTLETSGSFVNYDGFFADAGTSSLAGGTSVSAGATAWQVNTVSAVTGYQQNGAAASGHVLRGDGTNFVDSALAASDLSNGVVGSGSVVLAAAPTLSGLSVIPGWAATRAGLTLSNGQNNNIAVTSSVYQYITGPTTAFSVTGFESSGTVSGHVIILENETSQQMTIKNNTGSNVGQKILTLTGTDVVFPAGRSAAIFIYDSNEGNWILISMNPITQFRATTAAPTVASGEIGYGSTTSASANTTGGGSTLPLLAAGYIVVNIAGTDFKVPYYAS